MGNTKSKINTKDNQEIVAKKTERWDNEIKADLKDTLDIDMDELSANERINYIVNGKLLPIQSGEVLWFNLTKGVWCITPSIEWSKSLLFQCVNKNFNSWENVNYIEINDQAIPTNPWQVKIIKGRKETTHNKRKIGMVVVTPEGHKQKDVVAKNLDANINLDDFNEWDIVEFIANEKREIVAIKKAE